MLIAESVERLSRSRVEEKHAIFDVSFFRHGLNKPKKKEKLPRSNAARTGSALARQSSQLAEPSADSAANVIAKIN